MVSIFHFWADQKAQSIVILLSFFQLAVWCHQSSILANREDVNKFHALCLRAVHPSQ